jgi:hypothetical protein
MNRKLTIALLIGLTVGSQAQDYSLDTATPYVRDGAINWCRLKMAAEKRPFDANKPEASCSAKEMLLGYSRERAADLKRRGITPKKFDAKVEADRLNKRRANGELK